MRGTNLAPGQSTALRDLVNDATIAARDRTFKRGPTSADVYEQVAAKYPGWTKCAYSRACGNTLLPRRSRVPRRYGSGHSLGGTTVKEVQQETRGFDRVDEFNPGTRPTVRNACPRAYSKAGWRVAHEPGLRNSCAASRIPSPKSSRASALLRPHRPTQRSASTVCPAISSLCRPASTGRAKPTCTRGAWASPAGIH
jgi:hypothetical protein